MTDNYKINEATRLYLDGKIAVGPAKYQGRSGRFRPILLEGRPISVYNITTKVDGSTIPARHFLLQRKKVLGEAQRLGMILTAWLEGYRGRDAWALAQDLARFLGPPGPDGVIRLELDVGPYLDRKPGNGAGGQPAP